MVNTKLGAPTHAVRVNDCSDEILSRHWSSGRSVRT